MKIEKQLTRINYTSANRGKGDIQYIVVHYVGATGSARNNAEYFYSGYRAASAHYFVGFDSEENIIMQVVDDKNISWHCGGGLQGSGGASFYKKCLNSNSIGIELCCKKKDGKWYFEDGTIKTAQELVKSLMDKYGIGIDHVIRHYDVTGKICPEPYVRDAKAWADFKSAVAGTKVETEEEKPADKPSTPTSYECKYPISQGSIVGELQKAINADIKAGLAIDNSFGPASQQACSRINIYTYPQYPNVTKFIQKYLGLSADGSYGPDTVSTVTKFQKQCGILANGVTGIQTLSQILQGKRLSAASLPSGTNYIQNDLVKQFQTALNKDYGFKLAVDGSCGPDMQAKLKTVNIYPYPADGYKSRPNTIKLVQKCFGLSQDGSYGPDSKAKVVSFQQKYGLTANGVIGIQTIMKLCEIYG